MSQEPMGGAVTPLSLAVATARLNCRIRNHGLSARELLMQRDQFNQQIPVSDLMMILEQHKRRITDNHTHNERSKAPGKNVLPSIEVAVGDLVYIHADRNKSKTCDRYLVLSVEGATFSVMQHNRIGTKDLSATRCPTTVAI